MYLHREPPLDLLELALLLVLLRVGDGLDGRVLGHRGRPGVDEAASRPLARPRGQSEAGDDGEAGQGRGQGAGGDPREA